MDLHVIIKHLISALPIFAYM